MDPVTTICTLWGGPSHGEMRAIPTPTNSVMVETRGPAYHGYDVMTTLSTVVYRRAGQSDFVESSLLTKVRPEDYQEFLQCLIRLYARRSLACKACQTTQEVEA